MVWITGSPADRHEIHAATRLCHKGLHQGSEGDHACHVRDDCITWIDKEEIASGKSADGGAMSGRSHIIVHCH